MIVKPFLLREAKSFPDVIPKVSNGFKGWEIKTPFFKSFPMEFASLAWMSGEVAVLHSKAVDTSIMGVTFLLKCPLISSTILLEKVP